MKDDVIRLRISTELKSAVKQVAESKGLSVSAYITMLLTEKMKEEK